MAMFIDLLPFAILATHFTEKWYLSQGRLWPVYILTMVGSICTVFYNCLLWSAMQYNHTSVLVFSVNSSWTIIMSCKGLIRLVRESKVRLKPAENKQSNYRWI